MDHYLHDLIVVGGGIAGLTASIYASCSGLDVLCIENQACGGQIINTPKIINYPGFLEIDGMGLVENIQKQCANLGINIQFQQIFSMDLAGSTKIFKINSGEHRAKAAIIATGATPKKLEVKGEKALQGRGVSYCATCDGRFFEGKIVAVVGGGVGCAIAYPVAKYLYSNGAVVHSIIGFRNKDLVILQDEFEKISNKLIVMTDDGSFGKKGLVTDALENLIDAGEKYDKVIAIGPLVMMKFVSRLTQKYNIKTTVSMNPIMIDGTGMCGGCRVRVGKEVKFACVDGPDFDGHLVDFDEAISRSVMYRDFERKSREKTCNLFKRSRKECQI